MRTLLTVIGKKTSALALVLACLFAGVAQVHASTSSSYTLYGTLGDQATNQVQTSASYTLDQNAVTWHRKPLASANYVILPAGSFTPPATQTSSSSVASSESGVKHQPSGSRRPRVNIPTSSSSSSAHSAISGGNGEHEAASGNETQTSSSSSSFSSSSTEIPESVFGQQASSVDGVTSVFDGIDPFVPDTAPRIFIIRTDIVYETLVLIVLLVLTIGELQKHARTKKEKHERKKKLTLIAIGILVTFLFMIAGDLIPRAYAAQTTPAQHVYNGRLLNASGQPVTTSMSIRFSYWKSVDEQSTDITGTGAINTSATNYASWQEVHTLTPNANGYFSVNLGDTVALPDMATMPTSTLLSLYLQVEVKPAASAETAYELLDSDSTDTAIDRSGVLSVPFAANADLLDQHEIGTGSGSIPLLTSGGVLPKSVIPSGTNQDTFTLDADNTAATSIVLQFGQTLAKTLSYNIGSGTFVFNASLQVQGNLTVTGLINGLDLATIQSSTGSLKASSGGGLTLRVAGGNYRLNGTSTNYGGGTISLAASTTNYVFFGSGGLTKNTTGFPSDESYIAVAQVVTNTGAVYTISDRRALQSDDREQTKEMVFTPEYDKAGYSGDGSNNVGQLSILYDTGSLKNFYAWTSTKSSLQDYDIVLNIPVPASFTHWRTDGSHHALSIGYRSTSTSSAVTKLDIAVYDSAGQQVTLVGTSTSLSSLTWATTTLNFGGSPVWTAGGNMLVKLKMSAKDTEAMHLGSLKLEYVELAQ